MGDSLGFESSQVNYLLKINFKKNLREKKKNQYFSEDYNSIQTLKHGTHNVQNTIHGL